MLKDNDFIIIRTHLVLVIPLIVDTSPLEEAALGNCTYHLNSIIQELEEKIKSLQLLVGQHTIKRTYNETYRGLVRSLSTIHGQNRASSYLR